jgi:hypothetical protein
MATKAPAKAPEHFQRGHNPSEEDLRQRAKDAVRPGRSVDYGSLSRAERDRLLSERFGI